MSLLLSNKAIYGTVLKGTSISLTSLLFVRPDLFWSQRCCCPNPQQTVHIMRSMAASHDLYDYVLVTSYMDLNHLKS